MASDSDGTRGGMRVLGVVAIGLAVVILLASLLVSVTRWEVTTYDSLAGTSMTWDTDRTHLFLQQSGRILTIARDGNRLSLAGVFILNPDGLNRGVVAYRSGWLFYASYDGRFSAVEVRDSQMTLRHGPTPMYMAAGGSAVIPRELVVFGNDVLLRGQRPDPNRANVVVALDMTDPTAIGSDPASLHSQYALEFNASVSDVLVHGSTLYVSEVAGTIRTYDLATVPPTALGVFDLGGPIYRIDVLNSALAVIGGANNRTVRVFDLSAGQPALLSTTSLEHEPARVTLEGDRAYLAWVDTDTGECGLTILSMESRASPREIMTSRFGLVPGELLVDRGVVFFADALDLHVVREAAVPSIVGSLWMQIALTAGAATAVAAWAVIWVHRRDIGREPIESLGRTR